MTKQQANLKFKLTRCFEKQGIKIAVIGLTTEDTAKIGNPEFIASDDFRDPKEEAKKLIAELKETEARPNLRCDSHGSENS